MDKKLKRQIGYRPDKKVVKKKQEGITVAFKKGVFKGPPELADLPVCEKPSTAKDIVKWLKSHPLIAWGRMCDTIGIDKSNFKRTLEAENPSIKPENILKIEAALKPYGYSK